jgi:hypothetical protein
MNFLKSLLFIVLLFAFGSHALAQCGGSFFKIGARALLPPFLIRVTADFNGDGKPDLLGGNPDSSGAATSLLVVFGSGNGTFGAPVQSSFPVSLKFGELQIADINADGKDDVFAKRVDNTHVVYRSNGDGTFTALAPTVLTANELVDGIADVNNDGRLDLFTRTEGIGATRQYRLGNTDGSFGSQVPLTVAGYFQHPGDFNNDGKVDFPVVVTVGGPEPYQFRINYGNGSGGFTQTGNLIGAGGAAAVFAVRDFNNDGKLDVALKTFYAPWKFIILFNHGNNNFTRAEFPLIENEADGIFIADFDGDNALDFLDAPPFLKSYSIWKNNGAGIFEQRIYNYWLAPGNRLLAGKFDGDGKTDFIRINAGAPSASTLFAETQVGFLQNVCNSPGQTKIVDFDHDSKSDMTVWRESDGRWRYLNRGTSELPNTIPVFNWGTVGDIPAPGDYDGDGATDYAVYRPSNGVWYIRNSSDGSYLFRQWGLNGDKPVASDYNGDGRSDIAVYRPSNGNWYVLFSGSAQYYIAHFGIAEDKPVQEDYDGDGKTDLAVYRPSTGVWYYLRSSDGSFAAILWGNSSDLPAPGDYDGDGKGDFCLFRPSTGDWHVRRSYNLQTLQFHYGATGDVPQGGDWDGDGISDFAVYRPSTKVWYMTRFGYYPLGETGEIPVGSIVR